MRILLITLSLAALSFGQKNGPDGGASLPAQIVGPNDLINVWVYDSPEFSRPVRVGADGTFRLPMLKHPIQASGLYPSELETSIGKELVASNMVVNPYVTVTVAEYQSRTISVSGSVRSPMVFQATAPTTLLEALARAGGLGTDAGNEILVTTTQPGSDGKPATMTRRVPVRALIDNADASLNFALTGGEEIRVPEAEKVYMVGNVKKPGAFLLQNSGETTVLQMVALAEGLAPYANKEAYIYRRQPSGDKEEIPLPLQQILDRKSPDVVLQANDILYVPDNKGKRMTMATIDRVIGFGTTVGSGLLIYGVH
jgi:polysaccharide export outer membrane protein